MSPHSPSGNPRPSSDPDALTNEVAVVAVLVVLGIGCGSWREVSVSHDEIWQTPMFIIEIRASGDFGDEEFTPDAVVQKSPDCWNGIRK